MAVRLRIPVREEKSLQKCHGKSFDYLDPVSHPSRFLSFIICVFTTKIVKKLKNRYPQQVSEQTSPGCRF